MKIKNYLLFVMITILINGFTSCNDSEPAIIPTDRDILLESLKPPYKLPQGNSAYDDKFVEFDDKYKVMVIYKGITDSIIKTNLTSRTLWAPYTDNDGDQLMAIANGLEEYFFKYLDMERCPVAGLPYYIYLAKNIYDPASPPFYPTIQTYNYSWKIGYAYKENCILGLTEEQISGENGAKEFSNLARSMMMGYIYSALAKGAMEPPISFLSFVEPILPDATKKGNEDIGMQCRFIEKDSPRYFRNMGFVENLAPGSNDNLRPKMATNGYSQVCGIYNKQSQEINYFYNFIKFALVYVSDEQYNQEYVEPQINSVSSSNRVGYFRMDNYPRIRAQYDKTVNYMLSTYGIDLPAIAKGADH